MQANGNVVKITFENQPFKRFVKLFPFFCGMLAPTLNPLQYKIECYEKDFFVFDDCCRLFNLYASFGAVQS